MAEADSKDGSTLAATREKARKMVARLAGLRTTVLVVGLALGVQAAVSPENEAFSGFRRGLEGLEVALPYILAALVLGWALPFLELLVAMADDD
jgi:hypothetical protein